MVLLGFGHSNSLKSESLSQKKDLKNSGTIDFYRFAAYVVTIPYQTLGR